MTTSLQITKEILPAGILMLSLKGSLNNTTVSELETTFDDFFNRGIYKFILDLSQLNYLTIVGAGAFVNALSIARENNGGIVLLQPRFEVRETLNLLSTSQRFTIANDRATARKVFG